MFRSRAAKLALLAAVALTGCSAKPLGDELAAAQPAFDIQRFFLGRTQGQGTLKVMLKDAQPVRVEGVGHAAPDGIFLLDQVVTRGTHAPERRQWRIRQAGPGRYTGTLSDATGPLSGDVHGNRLHISYPMKGGMRAEQWIYLQPGGRTALNRMAITKLGITVARLDETIRKLD